MNNEKDKRLDDLFKKKLEDPVDPVGYNEADWDSLEQMLDKRTKRGGIIYWLPILGGIAASLLLFFGYWVFFRPQAANQNPGNNTQAGNHPKVHSGINGGPIRQQAGHSSKTSIPVVIAGNPNMGKHSSNSYSKRISLSAGDGSRPTTGPAKPVVNDALSMRSDEVLTAVNPVPVFGADQVAAPPIISAALQKRNVSPAAAGSKGSINKINPRLGYHPQFALSVLAAPDINGVGSFQQAKVGTNEGLLFSAGVTKKLTLSTGVIYSVKPYLTGFGNYHTPYQFPTDPVNVTADCRMLDIPLNIGYQVYSRQQNKIALGTGLSSYIMVHESYKFSYDNAYITGPSSYTVPNSNKYFFGVLNLNATFQHQVSQKVAFSVQPYMKLPLTNIGYSQVRLQTTGVAVGLSWNLNSLSKP
jgi:hypothetical protein